MQYRFYLCGGDGHFLRVRELACDDADIKATALTLLHDQPDHVAAVEAWDMEKRLARVERH
jgi:hypothetical protein